MRVKSAAKTLGIHPDTLRRWERLGLIKSTRHPINNYRLFNEEEIQEVLKKLYQHE
ncbi:MAG: MerR family transcriptional regulator [Pseudobdellovibrionaceae bacterium]